MAMASAGTLTLKTCISYSFYLGLPEREPLIAILRAPIMIRAHDVERAAIRACLDGFLGEPQFLGAIALTLIKPFWEI